MTRPRFVPLMLAVVVAALGCADQSLPTTTDPSLSAKVSTSAASLAVSGADVAVEQTSAPIWTLAKTGAVNTATSMVTWQITATEGTALANALTARGVLTLTNDGTAPAAIGNLVVNLQAKNPAEQWSTRSSNVANATTGDAATTAKVVSHGSSEGLSMFTENAASGAIMLTEAGAPYPLKPTALVAPGATVTLGFSATFDNDVLALAPGTAIRAEVLVSFGNGGGNATNSEVNLDINGNGTIDPAEAQVRTVPTRHGGTVPAAVPSTVVVAITDTPGDITTTGTATWSNPVIQLGAATGTASVSYSGGASGGTITNCAQLSGTTVEACDTQTIPASPQNLGIVTYSQEGWDNGTGAALLLAQFSTVYFPALEVIIGLDSPSLTTYSIVFESATAILEFLPNAVPPPSGSPLNQNHLNPDYDTEAGPLAGEVLALRLNLDFAAAGLLPGGNSFGALRICNYLPEFDGLTVFEFMDVVNIALGAGPTPFSLIALDDLGYEINRSFEGGVPNAWALAHLVNGACPIQNLGIVTYDQANWGATPAPGNGAALLQANFDNVYTVALEVAIGIEGSPTYYSLVFRSVSAILAFLPQAPPPPSNSPLLGSWVDPTTTNAGPFAGDVLALRLNLDFTAAGIPPGGNSFGALRICNLPAALDALNGLTILEYMDVVNTALGGGVALYPLDLLGNVADEINRAFAGGVPSTFAQQNLIVGACP